MARLSSYCQYVGALVAYVTLFSIFNDIAAAIPLSYGVDDPMPAAATDSIIALNAASATSLSLFIISGLLGIKNQSVTVHDEFDRIDSTALSTAENLYGSTETNKRFADFGMMLSAFSILINIAFAGTSIAKNETKRSALLPKGWILAVFGVSAVANLVGFVLFNILSARNAKLLEKKYAAEIDILRAGMPVGPGAGVIAPVVAPPVAAAAVVFGEEAVEGDRAGSPSSSDSEGVAAAME